MRILIRTSFVYPPIPVRNCDWAAVTDSYEPGDFIGRGETEAEAIADLKEYLESDLPEGEAVTLVNVRAES